MILAPSPFNKLLELFVSLCNLLYLCLHHEGVQDIGLHPPLNSVIDTFLTSLLSVSHAHLLHVLATLNQIFSLLFVIVFLDFVEGRMRVLMSNLLHICVLLVQRMDDWSEGHRVWPRNRNHVFGCVESELILVVSCVLAHDHLTLVGSA